MSNLENLDHLSYSSINLYTMCPRAWRYRYLEKVETLLSPYLVFGSAFHQTIEKYLNEKHAGNKLDADKIFEEVWKTNLENESREVDWSENSEPDMLELGIRMFASDDISAQVKALEPAVKDDIPLVEKYVEMSVPGVPIPIIGYIDIITADGVPGDFKTSGRKWWKKKAVAEMQPVFYLAALNQEGYAANPELKFRHYIFTKTKSPAAQVFETQRTVQDIVWLFGLIVDVWQSIEAGCFPPSGVGSWKCGRKYCDYYSICKGV